MDGNPDSFLQEVGRRLADARKNAGLSQTDFGSRIGKSQNAISHYEQGTRELGISDLAVIANELKLPITYFYNNQSIAEDIALANEIFVPALRVAAKITLYRFLTIQYYLIDRIQKRIQGYMGEVNPKWVEQSLFQVQREAIDEIEDYRELLVEFYEAIAKKKPDRDPFEQEFNIYAFLSADVRQFFEQKFHDRKLDSGDE